MNKTSWKTTTAGILGAVSVLIGSALTLLDNDPNTNPNWEMVFTALSLCGGLIFARDNNRTSAQVGAEPSPTDEPLVRVDVPKSKNNPLTYLWLIVPLLFVGCKSPFAVHIPTNVLKFTAPNGALTIEHPQNFDGTNMEVDFETNGTVHAKFGHIHSENDPATISAEAAGESAKLKAFGGALADVIKAQGAMAGKAANTAVTGKP